ncbi:hypothetical protein A2U01_0101120, partial [Trifolium medium]|nr:hypothetical protein [Trifolium medium]
TSGSSFSDCLFPAEALGSRSAATETSACACCTVFFGFFVLFFFVIGDTMVASPMNASFAVIAKAAAEG